jgi:prepilin-type N-terminal cleavage/methylation domain-containing protein/prepilin-type processing-associated H-X9-DG protein
MNNRRNPCGAARPCRSGITLVEVLVVCAIIGVLLAIALPAVQLVRDAAARLQCASNLRQMALAVHHFATTHDALPQGCAYPFVRDPIQLTQQIGISWQTSILPYVEQDELWRRAWTAHLQDPSGESPLHFEVGAKTVRIFTCPSEPRQAGGFLSTGISWGVTNYLGVAGTGVDKNDGVFHKNYSIRFTDIGDGTSNTLLIGERPTGPKGVFSSWYSEWGDCVCPVTQILPAGSMNLVPFPATSCPPWTSPLRPGRPDEPCDVNHFWSLHIHGANFAFADGSVRFIPYSHANILPALATRADGEIVSLD